MSSGELTEFEHLLEAPDHDLYGWILGSIPVPAAFDHPLIAELRAFVGLAPPGPALEGFTKPRS